MLDEYVTSANLENAKCLECDSIGAVYVPEPGVLEVVELQERCGGCSFYKDSICRKRGGKRPATDGAGCRFFQAVRNG